MDPILAHLVAEHTFVRNTSEQRGRVVYIIAKNGNELRAGEIFISPIAYNVVLSAAMTSGDGSVSLAVHWLDQSPLQYVNTYPQVAVKDIVMQSLSAELIISRMRRFRKRMERIAKRN